MERDRNRLLIIIASIAGVVILALGGLYIALDFIEEQQERQQLTHQQQPPQQAEDMNVIDIEPPVAEQPPVQEEPPPPAQDLPVAAPEQLPAAGQQGRQIGLDEARAIAERHLQSRNIQATFRNHSGIDREAGTRVWELEYRGTDGLSHEFYIDVYTGDIVKFETGDWD
ncbi:hypothetical protein ET009_03490 [Lactococcus garvieae]|nr:hypothetical protein [Lactococcus garvieae]